jgi:hypothetical protein
VDLSNHESPIGLYPDLLQRKRTNSFQILDAQVKPIGKAPEGVSEATENPYLDLQKTIVSTLQRGEEDDFLIVKVPKIIMHKKIPQPDPTCKNRKV